MKYNNWVKDPIDLRDYKLSLQEKVIVKDKVDLSHLCSPVEDQGDLGSCTGNAIVGVLEYLNRINKKNNTDLSRLFIYYNERAAEGTVNEDAGAIIRNGIKSIAEFGVCPESNCKYDISKFTKKPTKTAYKNALRRRISSYSRLSSLDDMIMCLNLGSPFVFGFVVYDSFETETMSRTSILPMPTSNNNIIGGHAVCAVGYDKTTKLMKIRNSWGPNWGDSGYFYMHFDYISNPELANDFWQIKL